MKTTYKIIQSQIELDELILYCIESGTVSVDFETNALPTWHPEFIPTILGVSFQPGSAWIIPLAHPESIFKPIWRKIFDKFCDMVICNPAITKIAWNLAFEYGIFYHYGFRMRGRILDAMLGKYLLDETRPNDLKSIVGRLLPEFAGYELEGTPSGKAKQETKRNFWENVPLERLAKYCGGDCDFTFRIDLHIENRLIEVDLYHLFRNLYMPLVRILAVNKQRGVPIDRDYVEYLEEKYETKIVDIEKKLRAIPEVVDMQEELIEDKVDGYIADLESEIDSGNLTDAQEAAREEKISRIEAGEPRTKKEMQLFDKINFGSPKQMLELLYNSEGGFQFEILDYTDKGQPSTGESTLLKLKPLDESGFIETLLELRGITKLRSTYITSMIEEHMDQNDLVHPSYLLHGAVTGRTSSRNPNFQNIPRTCISADQKILTNRGWENIGQFVPKEVGTKPLEDLSIMTHKGDYQRALFGVNKGKEEMFKVDFGEGITLTCTMGHRMLTTQGWKSLKEIIDNNLTVLKYGD